MNTREMSGFQIVLVALGFVILAPALIAETLYVDSRNGNDKNPGTKEKPLCTITQAAATVNDSNAPGPTTIKIAPGIYNLTKAVLFDNKRPYTKEKRLTIEATILPDDPNWKPASMPIILSTENPPKGDNEKHMLGLKIEKSHVTVRGLKFLGNPAPRTWHYPIFREGKNLEDLLVTQCLFIGDRHTIPYNCSICANGHGLVVDHCIFYNCEIPVIFWNVEEGLSKGNVMRHCIIDGARIAGVWICQTGEDFEFHHNVITRSEYFWMRSPNNKIKYRIHDCIVTDNKYYSGYGTAASLSGQTGLEVTYQEKNIIKQGQVILEKGEVGPSELSKGMPRNYLHVVPGTLGSDLGAGLFKKK